jgi:hypothetical protein
LLAHRFVRFPVRECFFPVLGYHKLEVDLELRFLPECFRAAITPGVGHRDASFFF